MHIPLEAIGLLEELGFDYKGLGIFVSEDPVRFITLDDKGESGYLEVFGDECYDQVVDELNRELQGIIKLV